MVGWRRQNVDRQWYREGLVGPQDDGVWAIYFNTVSSRRSTSATSSSAGNPKVVPMSSDTFVIYLSGCSVEMLPVP